ncbi:MAG: RpiB/LacA/LacB family sugar-phosphate isomerase [Candidatus Peribacteraceae bacterium]|nr:RpiB/LacA/LacB family sugar-phosphate isomerase [Candidatus Peribacteraceae bacterium]
MDIGIVSDRKGFNFSDRLESELQSNGYKTHLFGAKSNTFGLPVPTSVHELCWGIHKRLIGFGIVLVDNSNVNIACITANRMPHIRASVISCVGDAQLARITANINVACINLAILDYGMVEEIIYKFVETKASKEQWHTESVYLADMLYIPK